MSGTRPENRGYDNGQGDLPFDPEAPGAVFGKDPDVAVEPRPEPGEPLPDRIDDALGLGNISVTNLLGGHS